MLRKKDLEVFYSRLTATVEIFRTINNTNDSLEKSISSSAPLTEAVDDNSCKINVLDAYQGYILSRIETKEFANLAKYLMFCMHEFNFKGVSSVPNNTTLISEFSTISDYEILSKTSLHNHTLNCALCSFEICKDQPQLIRDIVVNICLLHDFGKAPAVQKQFKDKNERHDQTSARFAVDVLEKFGLSEELKKIIYTTLFNHHSDEKNKEQTLYTPFLISSDIAARTIEKKFTKSRK